MIHQVTAAISTTDKAKTHLKDCITILDGALTLYYEDRCDIDSEHSNTPKAMRYLDGYAYMTAVVFAVFNRVHDALTALEGKETQQHDSAENDLTA